MPFLTKTLIRFFIIKFKPPLKNSLADMMIASKSVKPRRISALDVKGKSDASLNLTSEYSAICRVLLENAS